MKFSQLNVDFNSASTDALGSTSTPHENIKFKTRFKMLLSTNLAWKRLQICTNLRLINKHC